MSQREEKKRVKKRNFLKAYPMAGFKEYIKELKVGKWKNFLFIWCFYSLKFAW